MTLCSPDIVTWEPPIPACERMRGLEAIDVWSESQIQNMREIKAASLCNRSMVHAQDRSKEVSKKSKNQPKARIDLSQTIHTSIVVNLSQTDTVLTRVEFPGNEDMAKEWVSITQHLDDTDLDVLIEEARRRARVSLFIYNLRKSKNPPRKYADCPRSMKLIEFIQKEWLDNGHNPATIDRKMVASYDDKLVRAIENHEYNNGILPEPLRFPKVGNRKSKNEMEKPPSP